MKCQLCHRKAELERGYCQYHSKAYTSLVSGYPKWKRTYEDLAWEEYLRRVIALPETGIWVKEVAEAEVKGMIE